MLEKVIIRVSRTQIQEIEISELNGYDMPKTSQELADLAIGIQNNPAQFIDEDWELINDDTKVESVQFIDKVDPIDG